MCRSDICTDYGSDCCAPGNEARGCSIGGYTVQPGGTSSYAACEGTYGSAAIYQCCSLPPSAPPPSSPPLPYPPPSPSTPATKFYCEQPECTPEVWDTTASNGRGTCGEQIMWVQTNVPGAEEQIVACTYVAMQESTPECAPCGATPPLSPPPQPPTPPQPPAPPPALPPPPAPLGGPLADLYAATQGAGWAALDRWMEGDPCVDGWQGVGCCRSASPIFSVDDGACYRAGSDAPVHGLITNATRDQNSTHTYTCKDGCEVVELRLAANGLRGPLNDSVCELAPWLASLDISANELRGELPPCLASMPLASLSLAGNAFEYDEAPDAATSRLVLRCKTDAGLACTGLPPDSCSAFGPEYRVRTDVPTKCVRCTDPTAALALAGALLAALVLLVLCFVACSGRMQWLGARLDTTLNTATIFLCHLQTLAIVGSLQLQWPASIRRIMEAAGTNPFDMGGIRPECLLRGTAGGDSLYYGYAFARFGLLLLLLYGVSLVQSLVKLCTPAHRLHRAVARLDRLEMLETVLFTFGLALTWRVMFDLWGRAAQASPLARTGACFAALVFATQAGFLTKYALNIRALVTGRAFGRVANLSNDRLAVRLAFLTERFGAHAPYWQFLVWLRQFLLEGTAWLASLLMETHLGELYASSSSQVNVTAVAAASASSALATSADADADADPAAAANGASASWLVAVEEAHVAQADAVQAAEEAARRAAVYGQVAAATLVFVAFWALQLRVRPYAHAFQNDIESLLFASNVLLVVGGAVYSSIESPTLEALLVLLVVGTLLLGLVYGGRRLCTPAPPDDSDAAAHDERQRLSLSQFDGNDGPAAPPRLKLPTPSEISHSSSDADLWLTPRTPKGSLCAGAVPSSAGAHEARRPEAASQFTSGFRPAGHFDAALTRADPGDTRRMRQRATTCLGGSSGVDSATTVDVPPAAADGAAADGAAAEAEAEATELFGLLVAPFAASDDDDAGRSRDARRRGATSAAAPRAPRGAAALAAKRAACAAPPSETVRAPPPAAPSSTSGARERRRACAVGARSACSAIGQRAFSRSSCCGRSAMSHGFSRSTDLMKSVRAIICCSCTHGASGASAPTPPGSPSLPPATCSSACTSSSERRTSAGGLCMVRTSSRSAFEIFSSAAACALRRAISSSSLESPLSPLPLAPPPLPSSVCARVLCTLASCCSAAASFASTRSRSAALEESALAERSAASSASSSALCDAACAMRAAATCASASFSSLVGGDGGASATGSSFLRSPSWLSTSLMSRGEGPVARGDTISSSSSSRDEEMSSSASSS